jgi:hypothetical protein
LHKRLLDRLLHLRFRLPALPLSAGAQMVHGKPAAHLFPARLPQADLQSVRGAELGLLSKVLVALALGARLVALSGAAAGLAGVSGHDFNRPTQPDGSAFATTAARG